MKLHSLIAWLPVAVIPLAVVLATPGDWPRWAFMWFFACALFSACKWLTWWTSNGNGVSIPMQVGYLILWPGLDAQTFFGSRTTRKPDVFAWLFALCKLAIGILLIWGMYPRASSFPDYLRGWVGMVGIVFIVHFGVFDLLSLGWQTACVPAKPLMNWPILARSVSEFWAQRWNTAFRDLTHRFLFRPLLARLGAPAALVTGFLVSGVIHDLVLSLPAQGGYGLPTLYFLVQAAAILVERSSMGRRLGLGTGVRGWVFAMLVLAGPVFLLFHRPFVERVMIPFLDTLTSLPHEELP